MKLDFVDIDEDGRWIEIKQPPSTRITNRTAMAVRYVYDRMNTEWMFVERVTQLNDRLRLDLFGQIVPFRVSKTSTGYYEAIIENDPEPPKQPKKPTQEIPNQKNEPTRHREFFDGRSDGTLSVKFVSSRIPCGFTVDPNDFPEVRDAVKNGHKIAIIIWDVDRRRWITSTVQITNEQYVYLEFKDHVFKVGEAYKWKKV